MRLKDIMILILAVSLLFFVVGCQRMGTFCPSPGVCVYPEETSEEEGLEDITGEVVIEEIEEVEEALEEMPEETEEQPEADIVVMEGELVKLTPQAEDPEGDIIIYTFSEPLDLNGEWQTEIGDAGLYTITITASDGVNEVSQEVTILVKSGNQPPVIEPIEDITVTEGETIELAPVLTDPEGDNIIISYSGWMSSNSYKTTYDDAGEYIVTITASDGANEVSQDVQITVENLNRPPVMEKISDIYIKEDDVVTVDVDATDPDGDELTIEFSDPLDENGNWITEIGDVGEYEITVTVTDGENEVKQDFNIFVEALNNPPVIEMDDIVEVDEGETIVLEPVVSDPDGDELEIKFSGWMTSDTYETTYDDAGEYIVTITVSDGSNEVSKDVTVIVNNVNRPPEFIVPY